MKEISLTQGYVALVDDADYGDVARFRWCAKVHHNTVYAHRMANGIGKRSSITMHRYLCPQWARVDHRDTNGLNNQRANLRESTPTQSNANRRKHKNGAFTSQYKGVFWSADHNKWRAKVGGPRSLSRQKHLGYFNDEKMAALAYNRAAQELFGEYALLNAVGGV